MTDELSITPQTIFQRRRHFIRQLLALGLCGQLGPVRAQEAAFDSNKCDSTLAADEPLTPEKSALHYNNYYEFSTNKEAVATLAQAFTLRPWELRVDGAVQRPLVLSLDDLAALPGVQRTYRLRCVEGWSMVLPWRGIPLADLLALAQPKSEAKFVRFIGTLRPAEMIGQRRPVLPWPYTEGLRLDEALHPLTLLATGLYDAPLSPQNGAPVRIVVPWKYAFKSIKAITRIELITEQPITSWNQTVPSEYGFYANVNPDVAHPRWSQKREVRIGELRKRPTLPFNGYACDVAHLYAGMDLQRDF
ncbi:MAG TPA: protein-methionine-sulfoxide reductase catalytic subunit MsrP [Dongiaceae bacterium]|nr:protein-methionine-sulfoxide reductase catalytic subunit MsrP [Dongiaceae bacterium]